MVNHVFMILMLYLNTIRILQYWQLKKHNEIITCCGDFFFMFIENNFKYYNQQATYYIQLYIVLIFHCGKYWPNDILNLIL